MSEVKIKAKGSISLAEKCPELIKEWDYDKNDKGPEEYSYGSGKKVWWKCEYGHSWETTINNRQQGSGCLICSNQQILPGYNDLATRYPDILKSWNYKKNNNITPSDVMPGSNKKVWWICNNGHEWESSIYSRVSGGNNCPICSNRQVLSGYNDLATVNPNLAKQWHPVKNCKSSSEVMPYSNKKAWWICNKGHEWEARINGRSRGAGCAVCNKYKRTSIPEQIIYYYIKKVFPDAINTYKPHWLKNKEIDIYIPSLKQPIEYDGEAYHLNVSKDLDKNKMIRENAHESIHIREPRCPDLNDSSFCFKIEKLTSDYSYMNKVLEYIFEKLEIEHNIVVNLEINVEKDLDEIQNMIKYSDVNNSISVTNPELLQEWNYDKNGNLKPENVTKGSHKKVNWICNKCGFEWKAVVKSRTNGHGCPECGTRKCVITRNENKLKKMQYIEKTAKAS